MAKLISVNEPKPVPRTYTVELTEDELRCIANISMNFNKGNRSLFIATSTGNSKYLLTPEYRSIVRKIHETFREYSSTGGMWEKQY